MVNVAVGVHAQFCPGNFSHSAEFDAGARFCPGCAAEFDDSMNAAHGPPARAALAAQPPKLGYTWLPPVKRELSASNVNTEQDGVRRFDVWRSFIGGVLDTSDGPLGIIIRRPFAASTENESAGGPREASACGDESKLLEILTVPLSFQPEPRMGERVRRLPEPKNLEPVIVQGVMIVVAGPRVLAVDLLADEPVAKSVLTTGSGESFLGNLYRRRGELLAVLRRGDGTPSVVTLQPPAPSRGVISLKGKWTIQAAASEPVGGLCEGLTFSRAVFAGDAVFLPADKAVLVGILRSYSDTEEFPAGARWVWSRHDLATAQAYGDPKYAISLGGGEHLNGSPRHEWRSHGILLRGIDTDDSPFWSLLRAEKERAMTVSKLREAEIIGAGGRIYSLNRESYSTRVEELDGSGFPRANEVVVRGPKVDRLLPIGDDLAVLVQDGHALKFWAFRSVGTPRTGEEGGQKLFGVGESLCPPMIAAGRVVCLWLEGNCIHVESAALCD
jgi:hypothetical protein